MKIIPRANQILIKLVEVEEVNEWGFVMGTKMEINLRFMRSVLEVSQSPQTFGHHFLLRASVRPCRLL